MVQLISIIILTYNQIKYTRLCLESLKTSVHYPYELIIVDNGSTDGTVDYLKSLSDIKLILNEENMGFAKGVNQGLKAAAGDSILLLNNDVLVNGDWLENMLSCLSSREDMGIVGPRTNYAGGVQGEVKGDFRNLDKIMNFALKFNQADSDKWFETKEISGFCMLVRSKVIEEIGYFDEQFKNGMWEDNDFCRRARNKGYRLYCAGDTFVYHFGSRSILGNQLDMRRAFLENKSRYEEKWNIKNALARTIVVLGMHRTGTSMAAGVLYKLGINMGEDLLGKGVSNPLGHFEDQDFIKLNIDILDEAGGSWYDPPSERFILKKGDKFQKQIIDLIINKPEIWGWKDPRTCLTIELFLPYLVNPYFIVCSREAGAVAESLKKRNSMPLDQGLRLKELYEKRITDFFGKHSELPRIILNYEEVTARPEYYINRIIKFLGIELNEEKKQDAVDFIRPAENLAEIKNEFMINKIRPEISTVLLNWNRCHLLKKTVNSYLQTVDHSYELIIVDNGSTDDSAVYIKDFCKRHKNCYPLLLPDNRGGEALNQALEQARGKFIHISENDLIYQAGWTEKVLAVFHKFPELGQLSLFSPFPRQDLGEIWINKDAEKISRGDTIIYTTDINVGTSSVFRREIWDKGIRWKNIGKDQFLFPDDYAFSKEVMQQGYLVAWNEEYLVKNYGHYLEEIKAHLPYYIKNYRTKPGGLAVLKERLQKMGYKLVENKENKSGYEIVFT